MLTFITKYIIETKCNRNYTFNPSFSVRFIYQWYSIRLTVHLDED